MAESSRISRADGPFNTYANSSVTYLDATDPITGIPNYVRLGLTVGQRNGWAGRKNTWNNKYALWADLNTRTLPVTAEKNNAKQDFIDFVQPLLNFIAGRTELLEADFAAFNIKKRDTRPTPRGPITTVPDVALSPLEGAKIRQRLRFDTDRDRASMHPLADGWERAVKIGGSPPANPNQCPIRETGTGALSTVNAGMENDRKSYYAFYRWVNITNPVNNSGWSPMEVVTISGGTVGE